MFGNWPTTGADDRHEHVRGDEGRLLFICTGNVARSAAADLIANQRYGHLELEYSSAGIGALVGHGVAADVAPSLARRGIDVARHAGRQIDATTAFAAGLILVLDVTHRRWLLEEWPQLVDRIVLLREAASLAAEAMRTEHGSTRSEAFASASSPATRDARGRRSRSGVPAAEWLARQAMHTRAFSVADPFRRGADAGETAVAEVDAALATLLPWYSGQVGSR